MIGRLTFDASDIFLFSKRNGTFSIKRLKLVYRNSYTLSSDIQARNGNCSQNEKFPTILTFKIFIDLSNINGIQWPTEHRTQ